VKASPEAQLRLLELADLDAELTRLENRRRGLPEHAELDQLEQRDARLRDTIASLEAEQGDLSRIDRDRQRLDAGQVASPRELENLQSEIVSLTRRQADLEEIVLDVMERQEAAQGSRESAAAEREEIAATRDVVTARRDAALAEIAEQAGKAGDRRAAVASEEPQDLLDLYGRMRQQHGGVGAAALRGGRCEGCHLSLNTVDLNNIRHADPDEVLRCEECRRILVRTPESGL
jgi:predicted  nucleic acid-binding Zn-ribbon protein